MVLATLNSLSLAAELAGAQRYVLASLARCGNVCCLEYHQTKGSDSGLQRGV